MNKSSILKLIHRSSLLVGVFIGSAAFSIAQDAPSLTALEQENKALAERVKALEELVQKSGLPPASGAPTPKPVLTSLNNITLSGFVQTSYFSDLDNTSSQRIAGYLWNNKNNNFSINKVKLTFASTPAVRSSTDWSADFRVSLMAGEAASVLNSGSATTGFDYLREAYVEMNVPVGKGLLVKAGELISLLNWESGDGGAANPNFSQGYQWWYTGNGPSAGVQADYAFTDWLDVVARVDNGLYAGPIGNANKKAGMVSVNFKPIQDGWFNVIGFGGLGGGTLNANGASVIGGYQFTPKLGTGFEADYFSFHNQSAKSGELSSIGGWIWYDFTPQYGIAFRAEYLDDPDGVGLNGGPNPYGAGSGILSPSPNGNLESFTLTFNWHPIPALKIQPEIRLNHTSYTGGFNGKQNQFIVGVGATYAF